MRYLSYHDNISHSARCWPSKIFAPLPPFDPQVQLDPSSAYVIPGVWKDVVKFDGFADGTSAMGGEGPGRDAKEEISDRDRVMSEQCDGLQGK